jgi:DNA-binding winged helix-turn-helix (wHTH) protein
MTSATGRTPARTRERSVEDRPPDEPARPDGVTDPGGSVLPLRLATPWEPPGRSHVPRRYDVLESARRTCVRSQTLIDESQAMLDRLDTVMETLRATVRAGRGARPDDAMTHGALRTGSAPAPELDETVTVGELTLLPLRTAILGSGKPVHLTPAEWQLLSTLVRHRAKVLSRTELAMHAWGPAFAGRHSEVEVYISRLRRKLARAGTRAAILTVRRLGYQLRVEPEPEERGGG